MDRLARLAGLVRLVRLAKRFGYLLGTGPQLSHDHERATTEPAGRLQPCQRPEPMRRAHRAPASSAQQRERCPEEGARQTGRHPVAGARKERQFRPLHRARQLSPSSARRVEFLGREGQGEGGRQTAARSRARARRERRLSLAERHRTEIAEARPGCCGPRRNCRTT